MKKIVKLVTIIFSMIMVIVNTSVQAYTVNPQLRVSIIYSQDTPYHYETEESREYKMLSYKAGTILYFLQKDQTNIITAFTDAESQKDNILQRILENGYPAKTPRELEVNNENEAYFATQEAIYAYLEHKIMDKYIIENEEGKRIIDCATNILEKAKQEEVMFHEIDVEWKVDEVDSNKRYKRYGVMLSPKIESANIILENATEVEIVNEQNQSATSVRNGDIIKICVPKGMNQKFTVKFSYEKQGNGVYKIYNNTAADFQYLLSVEENIVNEEEFMIDFQNLASVTINNYTYEEKEPIAGSRFSILNSSDMPIKEDLLADENGKIHIFLEQGKYYLKQTSVKEGYSLAEELIGFEIKQLEDVTLNILNAKESKEEIKKENTRNEYNTRK